MNKKLEFYVLNYNFNEKKVEMFNIFRNIKLAEGVEEEVKRYLKDEKNYTAEFLDEEKSKLKGYEALKTRIDKLIQWQEWGRREYEISVGDAFETDCSKLEKWDCYSQAHANIDVITKYCIDFYRK